MRVSPSCCRVRCAGAILRESRTDGCKRGERREKISLISKIRISYLEGGSYHFEPHVPPQYLGSKLPKVSPIRGLWNQGEKCKEDEVKN